MRTVLQRSRFPQSPDSWRAGPPVVQRKVKLSEFLTKEDVEQLQKRGVNVNELEEVQDLLANPEAVNALLGELEGEALSGLEKSSGRPTRAVSSALYAQESKWMNGTGDKKKDTIKTEGVVPTTSFLEMLSTVRPLKDTGAAGSHGEHAHRLQWYMISRHVERKFQQQYGDEFLKDEKQAGAYKQKLQGMYAAMADPRFVKIHDEEQKKLRASENETEIEQDVPEKKTVPLPLWSAILDVRGSHVDKGVKEPSSAFGMFGDVFAAAPVKLTGALTYDEKSARGSLLTAGKHLTLSRALLNRRLKRFFKGKPDKSVKDLLTHAKLTEPPTSFEEREKLIDELAKQ
jgi:hypothetical protein